MAFSLKKILFKGPTRLLTAPFKSTKRLLKGDIKGAIRANHPLLKKTSLKRKLNLS